MQDRQRSPIASRTIGNDRSARYGSPRLISSIFTASSWNHSLASWEMTVKGRFSKGGRIRCHAIIPTGWSPLLPSPSQRDGIRFRPTRAWFISELSIEDYPCRIYADIQIYDRDWEANYQAANFAETIPLDENVPRIYKRFRFRLITPGMEHRSCPRAVSDPLV